MENYRYPAQCSAIIDVTKPPYCLDNTGQKDCTAALRQIVNDILGAYEKEFYKTKEKLEQMPDPNALISFEIRKVDGRCNVIFPEQLPPSRIIYFPNGTYLVSDTISYAMEEFRNIICDLRHLEMNCQLRFMGQSRNGVVIKLKDHCPGFEFGNDRPVICFMQGEASNIAMTNMFENITVDVGSGNPGATGIRYFANNTGALRNVKIVSSDPEYRGNTGLSVLHDKVSACYAKNVEVIGFNYGIKIMSQYLYTTFEHIVLKHQKRTGFYVGNNAVFIRDLYSENSVSALKVDGFTAFVSLIDAQLLGGAEQDVAIRHSFGQLFLRNIKAEGYEHILDKGWSFMRPEPIDGYLKEYSSHGPKTLFEGTNSLSLNLPVLETPEVPWDDPESWVSVQEFGAVGDGVTDDTEAIRRAMQSGKPTVYFNPGRFKINGVIEIPATVRRVNFMYGDLLAGEELTKMHHTGAFLIRQETDAPLIIEDLFAWEKFYGYMTLVEHACKRTVIFSDVHVQAASIYFNTVPGGKVFMENTGCTIGGIPGAGARTKPLPGEEKFPYDRAVPCFAFNGQEVYCRQINPERSLHEVVNNGGKLWVLGCKTEEEGTAFETLNHGSTEVLGAVFAIGLNKPLPAVINNQSNVSVFASTFGMTVEQQWPIAVRETQNGVTRELKQQELPIRYMQSYTIPLYVGRENNN